MRKGKAKLVPGIKLKKRRPSEACARLTSSIPDDQEDRLFVEDYCQRLSWMAAAGDVRAMVKLFNLAEGPPRRARKISGSDFGLAKDVEVRMRQATQPWSRRAAPKRAW